MSFAVSARPFLLPADEHRREEDRAVAERILHLKDWGGHFMVGQFSIPLYDKHVSGVRPTEDTPHHGLDFDIEPGSLTVRVTFLEHKRD